MIHESTAGTVRCDRGHLIALTGLTGFPIGGRCASNERNQVAFLRSGLRSGRGVEFMPMKSGHRKSDRPAHQAACLSGYGVSPINLRESDNGPARERQAPLSGTWACNRQMSGQVVEVAYGHPGQTIARIDHMED